MNISDGKVNISDGKGHLHFPDIHVYIGPIIKTLRKIVSTVPLGLPHFLEGDQGDARVILSKTQKPKDQNSKLKTFTLYK